MRHYRRPFWHHREVAAQTVLADDRESPVSTQGRKQARTSSDQSSVELISNDILLSTKEAARYLNYIYSHRSLERLRCEGNGPAFVKMSGSKGRVLYRRSELDRWLKAMRHYQSTSEYDRG